MYTCIYSFSLSLLNGVTFGGARVLRQPSKGLKTNDDNVRRCFFLLLLLLFDYALASHSVHDFYVQLYDIPRARRRTITEYDDDDRVIHYYTGGGCANCFLRPFYVTLIIIIITTTTRRPIGWVKIYIYNIVQNV